MPCLIQGYNYDIFISYRQKDNKNDGWVTEFVNHLKKEIESTFKDEIGVYFDENPKDGLLETHDVDESLKDKLKCLIFIPIISRTYCDPKSFAWEHEFKPFLEFAKQDQFGLKIRLPGTNVANRIIPVKIHEIDDADLKECESLLGGHLRSIDFIFRSPGVNRPLRAHEDDPHGNQNKTYYRNEINKVANSISEVISGIKNHQENQIEKTLHILSVHKKTIQPNRVSVRNILLLSALAILLTTALGLYLFKFRSKDLIKIEKSIAVLPFVNDSPDSSNTYLISGIMEEILNNLQAIRELRVISRTSVEQFRGTNKPDSREIARRLNVNYIVEGSGQKFDDHFVLRVQLIAVNRNKEMHLWGHAYEETIEGTSNIIDIQNSIARKIAEELNAKITPQEKELLEKIPTTNIDALFYYQKGRQEHLKYSENNSNRDALTKAKGFYNKALECDPEFAQAYLGLARVYWDKNFWAEFFKDYFLDSVRILADKALSYNIQLADAYTMKGEYFSKKGGEDGISKAIKNFDRAIKLNPNDWMAYERKAKLFDFNDYVIEIDNLEKAAIRNYGNEKPDILRDLAWAYLGIGFKDKCVQYLKDAVALDGDSGRYYYLLGSSEALFENFDKAIFYYKKSYRINPTARTGINLGLALTFNRKYEEALKYYTELEQFDNEELFLDHMHRIGYAYWINGFKEKAGYYFSKQLEYCEKQLELKRPYPFIYYDLAAVYAFKGEGAYEYLHILNKRKTMPYFMVFFINYDPLFNNIRNEPEFQQIVHSIQDKYLADHKRVEEWLEKRNRL